MGSFKKWMQANNTPNFAGLSTISGLGGNQEVEADNWMPDNASIIHGLNMSNRIRGFFPAFRRSMKDKMILKAFEDALKKGLSKNSKPFDYSRQNYLNDEIQKFIADRVGMRFEDIESYCQHLKWDFINIFKNVSGWDHNQQSQNWPGMS